MLRPSGLGQTKRERPALTTLSASLDNRFDLGDCLRAGCSRAEMRMANEIDRGQERGEIAKDGQHGETVHTADSLGLDRRRVSEWREVRDAGEEVVEGAIRQALEDGQAPIGQVFHLRPEAQRLPARLRHNDH